ncbi:hypothetical protein AOLI_G00326070 [Acnodon oligacanthus]
MQEAREQVATVVLPTLAVLVLLIVLFVYVATRPGAVQSRAAGYERPCPKRERRRDPRARPAATSPRRRPALRELERFRSRRVRDSRAGSDSARDR